MRIILPSRARLNQEISRTFLDWGKRQVKLIKSAFYKGGHQHHGGQPWPSREELHAHPTLLKSGSLMRSVFSKKDGRGVAIGASARHAIFHQKGTSELPPRPIVVVTKKDITELKKRLRQNLERIIRGR